jgi:segregation and condensation protein B
MDQLQQHIEAIIFSSDHPVTIKELKEVIEKVFEVPQDEQKDEDLSEIIEAIKEKFSGEKFAFELVKSGGGYQFFSKAEYHASISAFQNQRPKKRLSGAALETLSIIAYKAPVTKLEVEQIRGVSCDYTIQKLLDKDLVEIAGKKDSPGKPLLYKASQSFLDYFGINSIEDLPKLKDLEPEADENEVGDRRDIEEEVTEESNPTEGQNEEQEPDSDKPTS